MRTPTSSFAKAGLAFALALPFSSPLFAAVPGGPPSDDPVELTGWLHVEDLTMEGVVLEVLVNGITQRGHVSESGRFTVLLPTETEAILRFQKEGHLTKEILVDTRHARDGEPGQRDRRVKFAVIMQKESHMAGYTYPGPVGAIGFESGGGCLAIAHDRALVPAPKQRPMVF